MHCVILSIRVRVVCGVRQAEAQPRAGGAGEGGDDEEGDDGAMAGLVIPVWMPSRQVGSGQRPDTPNEVLALRFKVHGD